MLFLWRRDTDSIRRYFICREVFSLSRRGTLTWLQRDLTCRGLPLAVRYTLYYNDVLFVERHPIFWDSIRSMKRQSLCLRSVLFLGDTLSRGELYIAYTSSKVGESLTIYR